MYLLVTCQIAHLSDSQDVSSFSTTITFQGQVLISLAFDIFGTVSDLEPRWIVRMLLE